MYVGCRACASIRACRHFLSFFCVVLYLVLMVVDGVVHRGNEEVKTRTTEVDRVKGKQKGK